MVPCQILHLDLSAGFPAVHLEPGYQGLYVVFWWRNIPLGHRKIPESLLPLSEAQLTDLALQTITPTIGSYLLDHGFNPPLPKGCRNVIPAPPPDFATLQSLDRPLALLDQIATDRRVPDETISVVICTRDRPEQLEQCLRSLQSLTVAPTEILVVDSAPRSDATRKLMAQFPQVRYVLESQPGLSRARNTGIAHSCGDLIAFTDDDVVVHPDWIWRLMQGFHNPNVMVVLGLAIAAELETESQWIFESRHSFNRGYRTRVFDAQFFEGMRYCGAPVWELGAGANMAIRRKAIEQVGEFDPRLGAGASGCSEDSEFWYRVLAAGWLCLYHPTAVVYHYHRQDMESLQQQMYAYMRGNSAALLVQFEKYRHWGNLRRLLATFKERTLSLLKGLFKNPTAEQRAERRTVEIELLGYLAGVGFYLRNSARNSAIAVSDGKSQAERSLHRYS
ncbi:glycosyltransferase [Leptolyngbya sp. DQ-M1]|uniref:glycosyltransferase family 2 protein n=1 Tax=Leptolyngbya sp. DQ-M1 TaxID=2933920 RepID=UPI003296BA00